MAELHAPGWVAAGVREGLSATAALRDYRNAGGRIRDSVWHRLYAEQKVATGAMLDEMTKPLTAVPDAADIIPLTTKRKEGYLQTLDIFTRVKGTDVVLTKPFMFRTDTLMSRGEALTRALTMMQQAVDEERYEEVLLGGVYTSTRRLMPGEVE